MNLSSLFSSVSNHLPEISALVVLIFGSAFFSGSEAALISISRIHARGMVERGLKGADAVLHLLEDRNRFLTATLIGNTVVLLAADSLATLLFIEAGIPHAALWSTLLMTVLLLTFGEIIPKTVAVADNERWAIRLAPMLDRIAWVLTPFVKGFLTVTGALVRLFGVSPISHGPFITEDDIRNLVNVGAEQKILEEVEREMIHSVIEFGDTLVREVMTPRTDMVALEVGQSARRALDLVISEGYSKLPIFEDDIDDVIGVVHDRELLIALASGTINQVPLRVLMRPITLTPESKRISELLREMQRDKFSLAIVVDEYGGTAGLVTLEDLIEEIVGEIRDEHDEGEEEPIRLLANGEALIKAATNIEDVNARLGMELPHEEIETIGGLALGLFGHVPREGDEISAIPGVRLRIERTRGRRILTIRLIFNLPPENDQLVTQADLADSEHV
ncbi:MAG TPA: hemolysin family protein [Candidatus Baltobacteraceae bacterium]|jgi:putative hemolysin|nr:hemolysin family protein [Candidatus Baltobacteraceae bacterium]